MELDKTGPDKEACTCPICMYIMIEPVTMPCKHTLCMFCYKQTVAQSNLVCPICRQRISVWARRAAKTNSLVDQEKWAVIQTAFPQKVKRRMEAVAAGHDNKEEYDDDDDDDSDDEDCETYLRKLKELSKPGEIREEYDAAMRKLQQQRELEAKREEEASAALIKALQEEEAREMDHIRREREEMERLGLAVAQQLHEVSSPLHSNVYLSREMDHIRREREEMERLGLAVAQQLQEVSSPVHSNVYLAREMDHIRREREEMERLGLATAQQLQEVSFEELKSRTAQGNTPSTKGPTSKVTPRSKTNSRQARPQSATDGKMNTLNNFFSPVPRTPSAPPLHAQLSKLEQQKSRELSPYPYQCISPKDKIFYGLSALGTPRPRSNSSSSDEAPGLRDEHSYTSASADKIDLTNPVVVGELCRERPDVETYDLAKVKSEPEDIFGPGPSGLNKYGLLSSGTASGESSCGQAEYLSPAASSSFQPIIVHQRTPPKPQANGLAIEVPITRITPRKILVDTPSPVSIHAAKLLSLNNVSPKMKSRTGVGKTSVAALINRKAEALKKSTETIRSVTSPAIASTAPTHIHSSVMNSSNSRVCASSAEPSSKSVAEALSVDVVEEIEDTEDLSLGTSNGMNFRAKSNCSDQENSAITWSDDLLSSSTWGFTPSGDQPLQVSKSSYNETTREGGHCYVPITPLAVAIDRESRTKRLIKDDSAKKKSQELSTLLLKKNNSKKRPVSGNKAGVKGKKQSITTSLDSFVQRKKRTLSYSTPNEVNDDSKLTQEEKDHILALQLQEMYEGLDRSNIRVDRFKGSANEYSLRKKRKLT
ncbi:E3 ubiquitin-protein ligase RNF168 [Elysia marginata]|uniref:RING-type E3 ubiquitin transferase n=1 Tax=Elysia marginata TaxID=1093978 RepID=A0AAV4F7C8_9GAST|nr:E3 ubiquitin-protein ligase RNF168 [Elysia marginata]